MIKDHPLVISVGPLFNAATGKAIKLDLTTDADLGPDIELVGEIKLKVELIKMKDAIVVLLKELSAPVLLECPRCLDKKKHEISFVDADREFFFEKPRPYDPIEHFLVDKRTLSVDLTEMLRQEIILHFPLNPICSKSCKGLCPECGENLNNSQTHKQNCHHESADESDNDYHRPFKNLKDLFNKS